MNFFDQLFTDEINWALHTTMTCNLRYSIELAKKACKKGNLSGNGMEKTAVFYDKNPLKGRILTYKASGTTICVNKFKAITHPLTSSQTHHAKISLISYTKNNITGYRLAVFSKNHHFNDSCMESALLFELKIGANPTQSGDALVAYLNRILKDTDSEGKAWLNHFITNDVKNTLRKATLQSELKDPLGNNKSAELYFGGITNCALSKHLDLNTICNDSIVITPPEFIRGTSAEDFFNHAKTLYDLDSQQKSSHMKLYLLHKKSGQNEDIFELWTGSANATPSGISWNFNTTNSTPIPSVECLVKLDLNQAEFDSISHEIRDQYQPFYFTPTSQGSLKKVQPDDFGPWVCHYMEIKSICYLDQSGHQIGGTDPNSYVDASKIQIELAWKQPFSSTTVPLFKSNMCWRPAEYAKPNPCVITGNGPFTLTYHVEKFRPSQGMLCFGVSESVMWIPDHLSKKLPFLTDKLNMDCRITDLLLSGRAAINQDELDSDVTNEGINWFYEITKADDKTLPDVEDAEKLLATKPMPFQEKAAERLFQILIQEKHSRAFLADEPGLGKTYSATKLICDMAAYSQSHDPKAAYHKPFLVVYVAPNRTLLKKNGEEIISKARQGLLKPDQEIHVLSNNLNPATLIQRTYESWFTSKEEEETYKLEERYKRDQTIDDTKCADNVMKDILVLLQKKVPAFFHCDPSAICAAYQESCSNRAADKFRYAMKCCGIGDGSKTDYNNFDFYRGPYIKGYYFITIAALKGEIASEQANIIGEIPNFISASSTYSEIKAFVTKMNGKYKYAPSWDEFHARYPTFVIPDRLAYAEPILEQILSSKTTTDRQSILLITVSQGVLFDRDAKPEKEAKIMENRGCATRESYTEWFINQYGVDLVIWDEFHRYAPAISKSRYFFKQEGADPSSPKHLFVSATPYRTNIADSELINLLFQRGKEADGPDDLEIMTNLPSFEQDFAPLFCGGTCLQVNNKSISSQDLITYYTAFNKNPEDVENKNKLEAILKTRMVRHERSRLQGEHEIHIRKYPATENSGIRYRNVFLNTRKQSRMLENAGYPEGARKWSLNLPWILDFATSRGKLVQTNDKEEKYTFFNVLDPRGKHNISPELFVYHENGQVKREIKTLPEQNIAFYQICNENARGKMGQLLWVPPTIPLYFAGNKSIFTEYSGYSKLLVFAEYRYLQRGGARLLSDFVTYENLQRLPDIPHDFPPPLDWFKELDELSKFDLLAADYRCKDIDDLICDIQSMPQCEEWNTKTILASIASPAMCAKRLGLDPEKIEKAFNQYFKGPGKKEALWSWVVEHNYSDWEEGILRYCAEGNLYAVLEEWLFTLKKEDQITPEDQICSRLEYSGSTVHVLTHQMTQTVADKQKKNNADAAQAENEPTAGIPGQCSFAEQLTGDVSDNGTGENEDKMLNTSHAFSSPLWPMVLFAGRGAQEGIDFHEYCLRIMHLTLPRGAVSYEQRNGRIDRFRSLLVRRRVAEYFMNYDVSQEHNTAKLMKRVFAKAIEQKDALHQQNDQIYPNWHFHVGKSIWNFEELIPMWQFTRESEVMVAYDGMLKSYRGSMGLNSMMGCDEGIDLSAP